MNTSPHLLFVTTSNLATNPRLIKEVEFALQKGYKVTIVCCVFDHWSSSLHTEITKKLQSNVHIVEISVDRSSLTKWAFSTIVQKFSSLLLRFGVKGKLVVSSSLFKRSILLRRVLRKLNGSFSMVIAHNPGAFEPVFWFAKKNNIPFGIDVEDYHPGETNHSFTARLIRQLQSEIFLFADYVSAASPFILEAVQKDCDHKLRHPLTVLNYFNSGEFVQPSVADGRLRCVWFSQHIDHGRGLEQLVAALSLLRDEVEVHLYGHLNSAFFDSYLKQHPNIIMHSPTTQGLLHQELSFYDIGLALENSHSNFNRDICITNKILSYFQAGLYIVASKTKAQESFIQQHQSHGIVCELQPQVLTKTLQQLAAQKNEIRVKAVQRYKHALQYGAEQELVKLEILWRNVSDSQILS